MDRMELVVGRNNHRPEEPVLGEPVLGEPVRLYHIQNEE